MRFAMFLVACGPIVERVGWGRLIEKNNNNNKK